MLTKMLLNHINNYNQTNQLIEIIILYQETFLRVTEEHRLEELQWELLIQNS
jgi:hypothetical protein